jgi:hypothetical protein
MLNVTQNNIFQLDLNSNHCTRTTSSYNDPAETVSAGSILLVFKFMKGEDFLDSDSTLSVRS